MYFTSPMWLIGLLGWAGVALWVMWGRRPKTWVSFLPLWQAPGLQLRPRRSLQPPPVALLAMLGAILLALFAAAGPVVPSWRGYGQTITVIVDRGLSMSAQSQHGQVRFVQDAEAVYAAIRENIAGVTLDWKLLPGGDAGVGADGLARVRAASGTGLVDPDALQIAARRALATSQDFVLVLSDQSLAIHDSRFIQICPDDPLQKVGIDRLSVRQNPHPQAMLRIMNHSPLNRATLLVRSGGKEVSDDIELPPDGQARNYFVDLPAAGDVVEAQVRAQDRGALNHQAWAVHRAAWPRLKALGALPPELVRMIEVYSRERPSQAGSPLVSVTASKQGVAPGDVAAIVADDSASGQALSLQPLVVAQEPLSTADVDWPQVLKGARAHPPPQGDWLPIVSAGGATVLAVRTQPARQVWVGFESTDFGQSADFVVFWGRVFNWLGQAGADYESGTVGLLGGGWTLSRPAAVAVPAAEAGLIPGLYRRDDGSLQALNAAPMPATLATPGPWRQKIASPSMVQARRSLSGPLLLLALALACVAAASWLPVARSIRPAPRQP